MSASRSWWFVYGAVMVLVVAAVGWNSLLVLDLERAESRARAEAEHQEAMRSALWRMDSWLAPLVAREAARPALDYEPFHAQSRAYTRLLSQIEPGEVLTPSPLLSFQSDYFRLHFQMAPDGALSSPQVPLGNERDLAEAAYLAPDLIGANAATLGVVEQVLTRKPNLTYCVALAENRVAALDAAQGTGSQWLANEPPDVEVQALRNFQEFNARQDAYRRTALDPSQFAQVDSAAPPLERAAVTVGPLVPLWFAAGSGSGDELIFVRRVRRGGGEVLQGFLCDWPRLHASLCGLIADLFPAAAMTPVRAVPPGDELAGRMMATIPAALEAAAAAPAALSAISPARTTLLATWAMVIAAAIAAAMTLRASIAFGRKRSRFASAVTHELRTPLTTFRLYTEMLAGGMVPDEAGRRRYLETLQEEAGRLSRLVENVLSYARLEEGRTATRAQRLSLAELLERVVPPLRRRAADAELALDVSRDGATDGTALHTDADAVGQVLLNLVDNACKYGPGDDHGPLELEVSADNGWVHLEVRDRGPGIPAAERRAIFTPFERGRHDDGAVPGIGLGLALARGLARELRGELSLVSSERGATFRLTLPAEG